ncbi:MAG: ribonuclease HI, partial [Mailhella sp.]|nr:ribonuclease HI [Mailhella sp.]
KNTAEHPEKSVFNNALKTEKEVNLYSDGSCLGNPGKGGYGVILEFKGKKQELSEGFSLTTNNRMELSGVIAGLNKLKEACTVNIYTDSQYVAKAIKQGWLENWKKNGWKNSQKKPVKNQDLWMELDKALSRHNVTFNWIKGHAGHPENERCDELARTSANAENLAEDTGFVPE